MTLSQLGYARRLRAGAPTLGKRSAELRSDLMLDARGKSWVKSGSVRSNVMPVVLDAGWRKWQRSFFYDALLKILRGEISVSGGWRTTLRNATVVAGYGYASRDVAQAFLSDMIAIEMLLTKQGDKYSIEIPRRVEPFIGWAVDWKKYQAKIRSAYKLRSRLVHDGRRDLVTVEDVLFCRHVAAQPSYKPMCAHATVPVEGRRHHVCRSSRG